MKKDAEWAALAVVILALFAASLYVVKPFIDAIILAAFFAYLAYPLVQRIERLVKNRSLAAGIVVLLAVLPFVILTSQLANLYKNEFSRLAELQFSIPFVREIDWDKLYASAIKEASAWLSPEKVLAGIGAGFELLVKGFIVAAGSFYMLRERFALKSFMVSLAPPSKEKLVEDFIETVDRMFYGVFFGHLLTAVATGIIAGVGYYALGAYFGISFMTSYPFLLGALTAIMTLLPIVGAWLVYMPMAATLFLLGRTAEAIAVLGFSIVFLSVLPDIIIRPMLSGKRGETHPYIVLLGFICGPIAFGAIGLILGPAILGLFKAAVDTYRSAILGEKKSDAPAEAPKSK